ncbi:MAG: hypothetical protein HY534_02395 [Chloroflexi bacterium]|nr:hypothetical protein [Chloroflexota bacterium]
MTTMQSELADGGAPFFVRRLPPAARANATLRVAMVLVTLVSACARQPESGASEASQPTQPQQRPTLTLAAQRELSMFNYYLPSAAESTGGLTAVKQIVHNQLVVLDDRGAWVPQLAAEPLSVAGGNWRVNPDGTMDTTWKLRPNIKWHDGTPFTADDLLFSFTVYKDPEIPNKMGAPLRLMESATAPDPLTYVVHWSMPYAFANLDPLVDPLPRHRFDELYRTRKAELLNSPMFREDFVGLGAYKLVNWAPGSHLEFAPFDDYYLGRPPLGKVVVLIIPDPTTTIANVLSGGVDVVINNEISQQSGLQVRDRWQGTGNQVQFVPSDKPSWIEIQKDTQFARPINGLPNPKVRQAFLYALDRGEIAAFLTSGTGVVADSWITPNHADRPQLGASIPQYPYNLTRAQQLLAEAGWIRGPGGVLVHQASREAFQVEARFSDDDESTKLMAVAADYWKALGAEISLATLTPAQKSDNEYRAKFSGFAGAVSPNIPTGLASTQNASPQTRWIGNRGGYNNPKVDGLLERYNVTIDSAVSLAIQREMLQEAMNDVAYMPIYFKTQATLVGEGVTGPRGSSAWNFFEWTKK